MTWTRLVFELPSTDLERLEAALLEGGAASVTLEDAGDDPVLEPAPGEMPLWAQVRVAALYPAGDDIGDIVERLRSACGALPACSVEVLEDRVWEREWLRHAKPILFGGRLCICPGDAVPDANAAVVRLDPGLAFGTGSHPSTALCLDWLANHGPAGLDVIDFGCGSGILSIAALMLGARHAIAVDSDPQARAATRANAQRNGVAHALDVVSACTEPGDVLLANILAGTLIELAAQLADCVRPGGRAVLAGLLAGQRDAVADAYRTWFHIGDRAQRDGWIRLEMTRRA